MAVMATVLVCAIAETGAANGPTKAARAAAAHNRRVTGMAGSPERKGLPLDRAVAAVNSAAGLGRLELNI
ncbi:hypothetical protein GCM10007856_05550 [Azospirillum oryzae]|nr:hypothetical protein GCM10007856_05550 [Azospirillum oryzae]